LFRDLLVRETAAPPWHLLVPMLRRLERQGEIRGGRFVRGVAGEQFAGEQIVEQLRRTRDQSPGDGWTVISAADPLNLAGVITPGRRVPTSHKGALIWRRGRCVAVQHGGRVEFFDQVDPTTAAEMTRALHLGRRVSTADVLSPAVDAAISPARSPENRVGTLP